MALINPAVPTIGDPNSTEDPDIRNALIAILAEFNGNIDNANIKAAAGILLNKLANQTAGQLLIANGSGVITGTTLTGDITNDSAGVTTIGANKVDNSKMAAGAALANLAANSIGTAKTNLLASITNATVTLATTAATTVTSVTPVAGTYFIASPCTYTNVTTAGRCTFTLRKNTVQIAGQVSTWTTPTGAAGPDVANGYLATVQSLNGTDAIDVQATRGAGSTSDTAQSSILVFGIKT